jgi:ribosomal protein L11 methyltransferase
MAEYLELTCRLPVGAEDHLHQALSEVRVLGAQVFESDGATSPLTVYLHVFQADDAARLRVLLEADGASCVEVRELEAQDWLAGWRESAAPFPVGRGWWVDPRPQEPSEAPPGRSRLVVEPRTAFGSGTHESTRLVLAALEDIPLAGRAVLDVGTGSGILAVAADRLGARPVVALDIDPEAVWVARRTAHEQEWPARPLLLVGPISAVGGGRFDVVLCNMITEEVRPLLPAIRGALKADGTAVLAGFLAAEDEAVRSDLARVGLVVRDHRRLGEWLSLTAQRHVG